MTDMQLRAARDPLKWGVRGEIIEYFAPLGTPLRLETNSSDLLEAFRTSFGHYRAPAGEADANPITAFFWVDRDFDERPPWPEPVFRSHGAIFYVSVGLQNTAVADLERRSVTAFLSPAMAGDAPVLRRHFLDCTILALLTRGAQGRYSYVHASAVSLGTRGLLFSGPSESGKSSLAYACARAGFDFVSDDVVYLREDCGELVAWGRPWRLRLLPDSLALFPELAGKNHEIGPDEESVLEFELSDILACGTRTFCTPAAVFFLERSKSLSSWEALDEKAALMLLSRDLICDIPEALARHQCLWQALARKGAFRLRCGSDLNGLASSLRKFLDQLPDEPAAP